MGSGSRITSMVVLVTLGFGTSLFINRRLINHDFTEQSFFNRNSNINRLLGSITSRHKNVISSLFSLLKLFYEWQPRLYSSFSSNSDRSLSDLVSRSKTCFDRESCQSCSSWFTPFPDPLRPNSSQSFLPIDLIKGKSLTVSWSYLLLFGWHSRFLNSVTNGIIYYLYF